MSGTIWTSTNLAEIERRLSRSRAGIIVLSRLDQAFLNQRTGPLMLRSDDYAVNDPDPLTVVIADLSLGAIESLELVEGDDWGEVLRRAEHVKRCYEAGRRRREGTPTPVTVVSGGVQTVDWVSLPLPPVVLPGFGGGDPAALLCEILAGEDGDSISGPAAALLRQALRTLIRGETRSTEIALRLRPGTFHRYRLGLLRNCLRAGVSDLPPGQKPESRARVLRQRLDEISRVRWANDGPPVGATLKQQALFAALHLNVKIPSCLKRLADYLR